ncbi:MAG: hypothetical protein ACI89X_003537 [Planctomycetota bacterium]|jgi:hypothetical protein
MPSRLAKSTLLVSLLGLTACGTSSYQRQVSINPPQATLYINGVKAGSGDKQMVTFSFEKHKRIYLQARHVDFHQGWRVIEEKDMNTNLPIKLSLEDL